MTTTVPTSSSMGLRARALRRLIVSRGTELLRQIWQAQVTAGRIMSGTRLSPPPSAHPDCVPGAQGITPKEQEILEQLAYHRPSRPPAQRPSR
ncbi:hypothetical protein [Streptomyces sp. SID3343]|uniref:hypothetical protein n=1 Tax=Streptomyces sp. SID3343 TaxID=2690260 RepID=UPI001369A9CB|nr:hypothetical protein [Streptomyces sp. SID3343]MYW02737.1 hypothetical protein [Streptomyces sp. SID3343]